MPKTEGAASNALLQCMPAEAMELLRPHLKPVDLPVRMQLERAQQEIQYAYFPLSGMASVVGHTSGGRSVEVALIGREGMTALAVILGTDRSPNETFMQAPGEGYRIEADALRQVMFGSPDARNCLFLYVQVLLTQIAQTCCINVSAKLEERLARWLLMAHDRTSGDMLTITHEFLSQMLGVRRPGVSVALHRLEHQGVITTKRGSIEIIDREAMETATNGAYGVPEAEFRRLFH